MDKYIVTFHYSIPVEAVDDEDAEVKAIKIYKEIQPSIDEMAIDSEIQ